MSGEIAISILVGFMMFCFAFLAVKIGKQHGALQILFLSLSLFTILVGSSILILEAGGI